MSLQENLLWGAWYTTYLLLYLESHGVVILWPHHPRFLAAPRPLLRMAGLPELRHSCPTQGFYMGNLL